MLIMAAPILIRRLSKCWSNVVAKSLWLVPSNRMILQRSVALVGEKQ